MKEKSAAALSQTADFLLNRNAFVHFSFTKFGRYCIIESVRQHPGRSAKRQAVTISPPQKGGEDMQITANDVFTYTLVIIGIIDLLILLSPRAA